MPKYQTITLKTTLLELLKKYSIRNYPKYEKDLAFTSNILSLSSYR